VTDRKKIEGACSTGQNPQRAVVPVEEEEEEYITMHGLMKVKYVNRLVQ
jgi:hypothetical protein